MPTIEKLTYQEKAKLRQLIHNILHSTKLDNTLTEGIIEQRKKLNLEEGVINKYKIEIKLNIRDIEMKNKQEVHLM